MKDMIRKSDALRISYHCNGDDEAYGAIAALPAVTVGVKPLVWVETNDGNHRKGECFSTRSPVSFAPIAAHKKHDGWWLNVDCKTYPTLDAAKAAAQADYEARILAALAPTEAAEAEITAQALSDMAREDAPLIMAILPDPACGHCGMDPAAIREAALREAAKCLENCTVYANQDRASAEWQGGVRDARQYHTAAILALIQKEPTE